MKNKQRTSIRLLDNRTFLLYFTYVISFLLLFGLRFLYSGAASEHTYAVMLAAMLLALYLPVLFFLQSEGGKGADIGLGKLRKRYALPFFLFLIGSFFMGAAGATLYSLFHKSLSVYGVGFPESFSGVYLLLFVLVPSFGEEFLCRGLLQTRLAGGGVLISVFCSAWLSAAFCLDIALLPFYFLAGVILAVARNFFCSFLSSFACAVCLRLGLYFSRLDLWSFLGEAWGGALGASVFGFVFLSFVGLALWLVFKRRPKREAAREEDCTRTIVAVSVAALLLSVGGAFLL